jgi:predicted transcriptional regulator
MNANVCTAMQLRVVRRLSLAEVNRRVSEIEQMYGVDIDDIPEHFAVGRVGREAFEDYIEWIGMVHALRAYREGEDFDYYTEEILDIDSEATSKLTPRRMELLDQISRSRANSINDLATKIRRNVKNVYSDLKALESLGLVELIREGRRMIPELLVQEVTILLW